MLRNNRSCEQHGDSAGDTNLLALMVINEIKNRRETAAELAEHKHAIVLLLNLQVHDTTGTKGSECVVTNCCCAGSHKETSNNFCRIQKLFGGFPIGVGIPSISCGDNGKYNYYYKCVV